MDKHYYSANGKTLSSCAGQSINDLVCGFYWEEDALRYYSIRPNQFIAWSRNLVLTSKLKPNKIKWRNTN